MATKKEDTIEINETKKTGRSYWEELVPYKIPIDRTNNDDVFVAVNGRSFVIQRGQEVMIPRNVAEVLKQSEDAQYQAFMKQRQLSDDFEREARRVGA